MSNNIIFVDLNDIKVKLEKLREEFHEFYDPTCEYGQGYLPACRRSRRGD